MDCPTITVYAAKCYKALVDSGAVISLIRYSMYQTIDYSFKTPIHTNTTKLIMADGFTHNFIICDRLTNTEILFGVDIQKKISLSYAWDKEKNCYIRKDGRVLTYTRTSEQKAKIGIVKSTLKIPPRHNGIIPMKIKGHTIKGHIAYLISDQDSSKGKDPNINIIDGLHNIKGNTSLNILVSNYTNKHITFNKGEYIDCLEPIMEELPQSTESPDALTRHSITTTKRHWKR